MQAKPKLELEPAELSVWPVATDRIQHYWRERTSLLHRPSRDGALRWVSASFLASCSALILLELRLDAATHLVKFRFGARSRLSDIAPSDACNRREHLERAKAELYKVSCGIKSQLQEKSRRCRTREMMLRLPAERAIARTVYEEVRSVHANSAGFDLWPQAPLTQLAPALA